MIGCRTSTRSGQSAKARPPTFVLFGNQLKALPESYLRYLTNSLRAAFDLPGTPIRLMLRSVSPEKLWLVPDCGFSQTPRVLAFAKLCNLVKAAEIVRSELTG